MRYRVNEVFLTIQGEATFTGTPAVFIRLQGCDVGCAFCDTKYTWPVDPGATVTRLEMLAKVEESPRYAVVETQELVGIVASLARGARHVVITGGEPADHDLRPLSAELERSGFRVQVVTSGTSPLEVSPQAWVTLSPKIDMPGGRDVLINVVRRADEIKHPCATESHLKKLRDLLSRGWHRHETPIWLQPLSQSPTATERCVDWCLEYGYRLSVQTHKFLALR